jgi:hypothetical protein
MHAFKLLPLFLGLALALPAAEADPNSLEARACTYSTISLPSLLKVVDQFTHHFAGSCVTNCCKGVGCNGYLNCGRSTVSTRDAWLKLAVGFEYLLNVVSARVVNALATANIIEFIHIGQETR